MEQATAHAPHRPCFVFGAVWNAGRDVGLSGAAATGHGSIVSRRHQGVVVELVSERVGDDDVRAFIAQHFLVVDVDVLRDLPA